ncbi:hypothetical protein MNBD_DELTA01-1569 [hydrothermal vent metagenome]|uniref:HTH domain of SpoOJ/ParA/ParB/repB family, involved in chromosome partitioning n=1 Tax=hydrothermal vent metagenome TaxID=652676 RepID=A0A3B0QUW6_9ZZZZ
MAVIKPLRAIRYNMDKSRDRDAELTKVMAPPYDVITEEFQQELYLRHPGNVIRLILGKILPDDSEDSNRYIRAAAYLDKWQKDGTLVRDVAPSIYIYTQRYMLAGGQERERKGFIALTRVEDFDGGAVRPHEKTLSGPKADRLLLMKQCKSNLSCIFSLYPESVELPLQERVMGVLESAVKGEPLVNVVGDDGVTNMIWKVDDAATIEKVVEAMDEKSLFIADGHHRYETAINYRNYMRENTENPTGDEPFNYVMMYFTSMRDDGLDIFPTHRVVRGLKGFDGAALLEDCKEYFELETVEFDDATEPAARAEFMKRLGDGVEGHTSFGLYLKGTGTYYILRLKDKKVMDELLGAELPDVYKNLDVTILHSLLLGKILGISQESQAKQENLLYIKSTDQAFELGRSAENQMVFIMNPTTVEQVRLVSEAELLMPQKSTYFYPKILSGLTINPLW